jgi:hypothetical protein
MLSRLCSIRSVRRLLAYVMYNKQYMHVFLSTTCAIFEMLYTQSFPAASADKYSVINDNSTS